VKELLKSSVKKRRQFFVFKPKNNWITILETDGNITFVYPADPLHLSRALRTRAVWFMFGGDYCCVTIEFWDWLDGVIFG
jgi:hypothetical protein